MSIVVVFVIRSSPTISIVGILWKLVVVVVVVLFLLIPAALVRCDLYPTLELSQPKITWIPGSYKSLIF